MKTLRETTMSLLFALCVLNISAQSSSQDENQPKTVFGKGAKVGFFGGAEMGLTDFGGNEAMEISAQIGWIVDNSFIAGIQITGLSEDASFTKYENNTKTSNFITAFIGPYFEPILLEDRLIHVGLPFFMGLGGTAYDVEDLTYSEDDYYYGYDSYGDFFYVFKPGIELELNLARFVRFGVKGTYRYTYGVSIENVNSNVFNGLTFGFTCKFGKFS